MYVRVRRHADPRMLPLHLAVVLSLCASLLYGVRTALPASAAPSFSAGLLGDLNPGTGSSSLERTNSWGLDAIQASGDNYFFEADLLTAGQVPHMYVSKGVPGSSTIVDPPQGTGSFGIAGLGDGSAFFAARNGAGLEDVGCGYVSGCEVPRAFLSDGTANGSCVLQVNGTCSNATPPAGLYLPAGVDFPIIAKSENEGVVFLASSVTYSSDVPTYGDLLPWRVSRSGGVTSVTSLVADFPYGGPGGTPFDSVQKSMVGQPILGLSSGIFATVGDTLYADLLDCNPYAIGDCSSLKQGDELYSLDLGAAMPAWSLVGGGMSAGSLSTEFGEAGGVAGGRLLFTAKPYGDSSFGLYVTDGDTITEVTFPDGSGQVASPYGGLVGPRVAVGDYLYFPSWADPNELWRWSSVSGAELVVECSANTPSFPDLEVIGSTLYFPCSEEVLVDDVSYDTGPELFEIADADQADVMASIVYDVGADGGLAAYGSSADDGLGLFGDAGSPYSYVRFVDVQLTSFSGSLYFRGMDPLKVPVNPYGDLDLYTLDTEGIPVIAWRRVQNLISRVGAVLAAGDRLFFWAAAESGFTGLGTEPWVAYVPQSTLSVVVSGQGLVSSDPFGISCVASPSLEDVCTRDFDTDSVVTLTAEETGTDSFGGWSSNCLSDPQNPYSCDVTMSQARTVTAFFVAEGDSVALTGTAPEEVGVGTYIPFNLTVRNLTDGTLPSLVIGVNTTLDVGAATAGCSVAIAFDFECTAPSLAPGESRSLTVYALAEATGGQELHFEIKAPPVGDDPGNNVFDPMVTVSADVLSLLLSSYPAATAVDSTITYGLVLSNGSASTTATGISLRAGFDRSDVTFPATSGCSVDSSGASGFATLVTCSLADLSPAGSPRVVTLRIVAPSDPVDLRAQFSLTYAQSAGTLTENDSAGPVVTLVDPLAEGELASTTQSVDAPTTGTTEVATLPTGGGLSTNDQSGAGLLLPGGFLGSATVVDVLEPAGALSGTRFGTYARTTTGPTTVDCTATPAYDADCLAFRVTIAQVFDVRLVYTFTFRFDETAFQDAGGAALRIRNVFFFHDDNGDGSYDQVLVCPRKATADTYTGIGPCLKSKKVDRATGDYVFVILTDTNGNWKSGRTLQ